MILETTTDTTLHSQQLNTAIHEMIHAMGFSASKYAYWRNHDGTVKTARDSDNLPNLGTMTVDGVNTIYTPDTSVMTTTADLRGTGNTVHKLVSPKILEKVREMTGCTTLDGAELENQGGVGTAGSHWEMRLFLNELMAGAEHPVAVKSELTLALLYDTGYYYVDFCQAEEWTYGANAGCDFANNVCLTAGNPPTVPVAASPFCLPSESSKYGCDFTGIGYGYCNAYQASASGYYAYSTDIDSNFRYFTSDSKVGGDTYQTDYCPYVKQSGQYLCTDTTKQPTTANNAAGELFSSSSRCFGSSLVENTFTGTNAFNAGCYDWKCDGGVLKIKAGIYWNDCPTLGGTVSASGHTGTLTCPAWSTLCAAPSPAPVCTDSRTYNSAPPSTCSCNGHGECKTGVTVCRCLSGYEDYTCSTTSAALLDTKIEITISTSEILYGDGTALNTAIQNLGLVNVGTVTTDSYREITYTTARRTSVTALVVVMDVGSSHAVTSFSYIFANRDVQIQNIALGASTAGTLQLRVGSTTATTSVANSCTGECCASKDTPASGGYLVGSNVEMTRDACMTSCGKSESDSEYFGFVTDEYTCCVSNLGATASCSTSTSITAYGILMIVILIFGVCLICGCIFLICMCLPDPYADEETKSLADERLAGIQLDLGHRGDGDELSGVWDIALEPPEGESHPGLNVSLSSRDKFGKVWKVDSIVPGSIASMGKNMRGQGICPGDIIVTIGGYATNELDDAEAMDQLTNTAYLTLELITPSIQTGSMNSV